MTPQDRPTDPDRTEALAMPATAAHRLPMPPPPTPAPAHGTAPVGAPAASATTAIAESPAPACATSTGGAPTAEPSNPAPASPGASGASPGTRRTGGRRWAELAAVAAIAAMVGSGATLAVTRTPTASAANPLAGVASTLPQASSETGVNWAAVAAKASPSTVAIAVAGPQGGDQGSGVVWDATGNVVTNNHVVAAAGSGGTVHVRIGAQTTYQAKVVGTDPTTDLAVVRIADPPKELTPIGRARPNSLAVGAPVMALGNPLGLSGTVTTGIVSALDRPVTTQAVSGGSDGFTPAAVDSGEVVTDAIQTSAAINPGNSGGALVDANGNLVGINSSIASLSAGGGQSGNIGIGFAIPVAEVENVASQLIASGSVQHASLGVAVADASVTQGSTTIAGAGVKEVVAGSPAAQAGLAAGDVVTAVDGRPIDSADGLVGRIQGLAVGQQVKLTVTAKDGSARDLTASLAAKG